MLTIFFFPLYSRHYYAHYLIIIINNNAMSHIIIANSTETAQFTTELVTQLTKK